MFPMKKFILIALVQVIICANFGFGGEEDYVVHVASSKMYYYKSNRLATFDEADRACLDIGAHLAEPNSDVLINEMTSFLSTNSKNVTSSSGTSTAWIGLKRDDNIWMWGSGQDITYGQKNWNSGYPVYYYLWYACGYIDLNTKKWKNGVCNKERLYICQKDICTNSSTICENKGVCDQLTADGRYKCNCSIGFQGNLCQDIRYIDDGGVCQYHINDAGRKRYEIASDVCEGYHAKLATISTNKTLKFIENYVHFRHKSLWVKGNGVNCFSLQPYVSGNDVKLQKTETDCEVKNGYICEKLVSGRSACLPNPCKGGTCKIRGCDFYCVCHLGYMGRTCSEDAVKINVTKTNIIAKEGDNITFYVDVLTYAGLVTIYTTKVDGRGHQQIDTTYQVGNTTLLINKINLQGSDNGTYFFIAAIGRFTTKSKHVDLTVFVPVKLETSKSSYTLSEVVPPIIACIGRGNPVPTISWHRRNKPVSEKSTDPVYQVVTNGKSDLVFKSAHMGDSGNYTCHGENYIEINEQKTLHTAENVFSLNVATDFLSSNPANKSIIPFGNSIKVTCEFEGFPLPEVQWSIKQGNEMHKLSTESYGLPYKIVTKILSEDHDGGSHFHLISNLTIKFSQCQGNFEIFCQAESSEGKSRPGKFIVNNGEDFKKFNMHGDKYYLYSNTMKNQSSAKQSCKTLGGTLASIKNQDINEFLKKSMLYGTFYYIGAEAFHENNQRIWKWADGTVFYNESDPNWGRAHGIFENWVQNTNQNGDCARVYAISSLLWYPEHCAWNRKFICEKKVDGFPSITDVIVANCSKNFTNHQPLVTITWRAHLLAVGLNHSIKISNSDDVLMKWRVPESTDEIKTEIFDLPPKSHYTVKIAVISCKFNIVSKKKFYIGEGLPEEIEDVWVKQDGRICALTWEMPSERNGIVFVKISVDSKLRFMFHGKPRSYAFTITIPFNDTSKSKMEYKLNVPWNHKYEFAISTQSCIGVSVPLQASGSCSSERKGPDLIKKPAFKDNKILNGKMDMSLNLPDETNGPISCLFVVVVIEKETKTLHKIQNVKELKNVTTNHDMKLDGITQFIALAIQRNLFNESDMKLHFTLGDDSSTQCNIQEIPTTKRKRSIATENIITAQNHKLDDRSPYRIYLVSTTPTDSGEVLTSTSDEVLIGEDVNSKDKPATYIIVAVIIAVLVLIILIAVLIFLVVKFKQKTADDENPVVINSRMVVEHPNTGIRDSHGDIGAGSLIQHEAVSETAIPVSQLQTYYKSFLESALYQSQYKDIKTEEQKYIVTTNAAKHPSVKTKNRYKNVLPYDHSKVTLFGDGENSYINANYIDGPLPNTVNDFWRMIIQENVQVIVMLCKIMEGVKKKCEEYWPRNNSGVCVEDIYINTVNEIEYNGYVKRTMVVTYKEDEKEISREITQFHYSVWPDHHIPNETTSILNLHSAVWSQMSLYKNNNPVLIHCSAGVGRTGTFIALCNLLKEAEERQSIDPFQCVVKMRKQRMQMIQNPCQYIFIHKLVMEKVIYGCTDFSVDHFRNSWNESTNQNNIDAEFQNLEMIESFLQDESAALQNTNDESDGSANYGHTRVFIRLHAHETTPPRIKASYVQIYCSKDPTVIAEDPTHDSIFYFLRMIVDNSISTIVMLSDYEEYVKNGGFIYWPQELNQVVTVGTYHITLQSVQNHGGITQRKLKLFDNFSQVNIVQLQCINWTTDGTPERAEDFFSIINLMQTNLRTDDRCGTVIHCRDGKGRSGLLCAITNLIERLKSEQMCDVFRTVKDLRDFRRGVVVTKVQYAFCYEAIARYLDSFKLYGNFSSTAV